MKHLEIFDDLRPVEALYLLYKFGHEEWGRKKSLKAVYAYLVAEDYLKIKDKKHSDKKKLVLTEKGEAEMSLRKNLKEYETALMKEIRENDLEDLDEVLDYHSDFKKFLLSKGITGWRCKKWLGIEFEVLRLTDYGSVVMVNLLALRRELKAKVVNHIELSPKELMAVYAFPSVRKSEEFKGYVKHSAGLSLPMLSITSVSFPSAEHFF